MTKRDDDIKEIQEEIYCSGCKRALRKDLPMYETAWSGVYWCGDPRCATKILKRECKKVTLPAMIKLWGKTR